MVYWTKRNLQNYFYIWFHHMHCRRKGESAHLKKKKIVNDVRFCTKRSLQNYFDIWLQDMYIVDVKANLHTWKKNWKCGLISWNFNMVKSSCFVFSFVFRTLFFSSVGRGKREGVGILIARKTTKTFYSDWCFYYN